MRCSLSLVVGLTVAQTPPPVSFSGVVPSLCVTADTAPDVPPRPDGKPPIKRSEAGVGALMPWADRLYMISYLSVPNYGSGVGLYEIDENLAMRKIKNHTSVYANRMLHHWTDQLIMGPYVIDKNRGVRTIEALLSVRIGAMAEHLTKPETHIYMVSMDGPFYEVELSTLKATLLFNLVDVLNIPVSKDPHTTGQCYPHFKDALTVHTTTDGQGGIPAGDKPSGLLYVASNGYNEQDYVNGSYCGRLASWDGSGNWTILDSTAYYGLAARKNYGRMVYATGWDAKSVILRVKDQGSPDAPTRSGDWKVLRLPKAGHAFDHGWQTEWPRIREVETERYLLDAHGMFYELSPLGWASSTWGVRPISQHLRVIPDFASYRGLLVMGGNEVSSIFDNNIVTGQAQSGLWMGKTDDLWSWGKPQGYGSVWREEVLRAGQTSDPFLMNGFDKKVLHLSRDADASQGDPKVTFAIELDTLGNAMQTGRWRRLATVTLGQTEADAAASWYQPYVFQQGLSAQWVRVVALTPCDSCTATFIYT